MQKELSVKAAIDVGDNLTKLIEKLANQIGVTADKIFPWYVKQAIIEGKMGITLWLLGLITTIILLFIGMRNLNWDDPDIQIYQVICLIAGAIIGTIVFIGTFTLTSSVSSILNPEYASMTNLLSQLSKLK